MFGVQRPGTVTAKRACGSACLTGDGSGAGASEGELNGGCATGATRGQASRDGRGKGFARSLLSLSGGGGP